MIFTNPVAAEPDQRDSPSPFGMLVFLHWNHDWNAYHYTPERIEKAVRLMREAGVGFVRMDFLWADIEVQPGEFNFEKYDLIVEKLEEQDIKILALLDYNPQWGALAWNAAPDQKLYVNYVRQVVRRYKDRIKYWEIWNEPDTEIYWKPQDSLVTYTALLKSAYVAIKEEDPSASVLAGAASQDLSESLENIYSQGAKEYFDVVNIHPFADPMESDAVQNLTEMLSVTHEVMARYGDDAKPIWLTEIGCPGQSPWDERYREWWNGKSPSEEDQARWVRQVYTYGIKLPGVKKVFWAFFRNTPDHFGNAVDDFGLVREDFSLKPSYEEYRKISKAWSLSNELKVKK